MYHVELSTTTTAQEHTTSKLDITNKATATATTTKPLPPVIPPPTTEPRRSMSRNKLSSAVSLSMSKSDMLIDGLNTDFTFSPITLAPESTRALLPATSMRALTASNNHVNSASSTISLSLNVMLAQLVALTLIWFFQL
ncbi:hypothetical protein EC973_001599 [Apophysomyces ossiformis]|uniref:Uncharacterized protein n=1 Tax=Apophysomyces ossiformis TaxID=679940 RepID=A0A8H7BPX9_9FUNG|nr:hypothetical protein EC973_001599 [Apophysomyces ossiformis]